MLENLFEKKYNTKIIKNLFNSIKGVDNIFILLKVINDNFDTHFLLLLDWSETIVEYCSLKLSFQSNKIKTYYPEENFVVFDPAN